MLRLQRFVLPLIALLFVLPAFAEPITAIRVQGNTRVEASTITSYIPFKVGEEFDPAQTSRIIRSLYATGLFANVEVTENAGQILIKVVENPMVNKVAFEGNKEIDSKRLREMVQMKPRSIYTPAKAQADIQTLQAAYRTRGRYTATIDAQLIQRDQNRVDVVYAIHEGPVVKISQINFVGNKKLSDGTLSDVIATRPSAWWRFLSGRDKYDPARIEVDKDLIRRHYLSRGFADVQVTSAVAELNRARNAFVITYTIFEGPQYDFGKVNLKLNAEAEGLNLKDFQPLVTEKQGDLFNAERVEKTTDALIDALGNKGFAFLDVKPDYVRNEAARTMDVTFAITPGPRVYVNRINIEGNTRTRDYVIRREMRLAEGDAFSADKIKRSQDRLTYLGFFEDAKVTKSETDQPDRVDLDVKVKEQSTGEFNVGAGYSTFDGILATADVQERNFLGKGQNVAVRLAVSQRQQNFNIGFTEPYFMNRELAAGFDVFNERTDYQSESSYNQENTGGDLRLGFSLNEFTKDTVKLGYKDTKISGVGALASSLVKRDEGSKNSAFLSNTWSYDNRDSYLQPTRGHRVQLTTEYSGFGGSNEYLRGLLSGSQHYSLADDWTLSLGARGGYVYDMGTRLPIYENFMGGGNDMRGFEYGGLGPRDRVTGDALGGKAMVGNNVELNFPLTSALQELGVNGILFSDGEWVGQFDEPTSVVQTSDVYRISAGAGVFWRSPIGPLRLEFGFPLQKAKEDKTQIFNFSVGSRF